MDVDSSMNADDKEQLQVEDTDDSCRGDFIEKVPLSRYADGSCSCTTKYVSGDWSAEVKQENVEVVKQQPEDVCCVVCPAYSVCHNRVNLFKLLVTIEVSLDISVTFINVVGSTDMIRQHYS